MYDILNRHGVTVDHAATQTEAFGVVDYMFRTDPTQAPFYARLTPAPVEAPAPAPKRSFFRRLVSA